VLPTHSESSGTVIAEALAHGLPVLTTTKAPWPMLRQHGCGWRVDANIDGIAEGLRQATSCNAETLQTMGAKGRQLIAAAFGWERIARQFVTFYDDILSSNPSTFKNPGRMESHEPEAAM